MMTLSLETVENLLHKINDVAENLMGEFILQSGWEKDRGYKNHYYKKIKGHTYLGDVFYCYRIERLSQKGLLK